MRFRTKIFLAALGVSTLSLLVAWPLLVESGRRRSAQQLQHELEARGRGVGTYLAATRTSPEALDDAADRLGTVLGSRVTLLDAAGRVLGDSEIPPAELAGVESHHQRPEVMAARATGAGHATRYSTTLGRDLLYVAVRVQAGPVSIVRLAEPANPLAQELGAVAVQVAPVLLTALASAALLAWLASRAMTRRFDHVAAVVARYARNDFSARARDSASDELGLIARALDDAVEALRERLGELSRDRARMGAILTGMVEGVLVVDEQGVVQLANDAARRLLRLKDEPQGRHYLELIRHPDIEAQISRCLRGEPTDAQELALAHDPPQSVMARATRVATPGSSGAVLVLHDITDLRRADRVRRDFVANVSHELRTPLTAIQGYVEALLDAPAEEAQTRRFLEIIARHSSRMERLVKDLLRLTRLDAGQEPLERTAFPVEAVFNGVVNELEPLIESREQHVDIAIDDSATTITGDPAKLHDVLRNLVENAVNYAPERTTISLSATRQGDRVLLAVADEGPGIPEQDLQRIFERFYRVDKARSRETGGTGLGLSIVKHLAGLHGGDVRAANRPGGGAVFTVSLPD